MKTRLFLPLSLAFLGFILFTSINSQIIKAANNCLWTGVNSNNTNDSGNWTSCGGVTPTNGDSITFPASPPSLNINNDLVAINFVSIEIDDTYDISGNELNVSSSIIVNSGGTTSINTDINIGTNNINLTTFATPGFDIVILNGEIIGSGNITRGGDVDTRIEFAHNSPSYTGTIILNTGVDYVSADYGSAVVSINGGTLQGNNGVIGHLLGVTGSFIPGVPITSYGLGALDFAPAFTVQLDINGFTQGTDYDYVHGSGVANLSGTLLLNGVFIPTTGDTFNILHADGGINGTFDNLPEGGYISSFGGLFQAHYTATDLTLTAVGPFTLFNNTFYSTPTTPDPNQPFTITSIWTSDGPVPTGTAELFEGSTSLGSVALVNGVATFNVAGLPAGNYSFTVIYSGDGIFGGATSNPLLVSVGGLAQTGTQLPIHLIVLALLFTFAGIIIYKKYEN